MCRYPHLFFVISPKSMRDVKFHSSLQIKGLNIPVKEMYMYSGFKMFPCSLVLNKC